MLQIFLKENKISIFVVIEMSILMRSTSLNTGIAETTPVRFSIIMPTYNNASWIRRAILSLLIQTYNDWELIIIDDGSEDDTYALIEKFLHDSRISYYRNECNEGLGVALNKGLEMARYDYIAYLPADDYYFENHLSTLALTLKSASDIVLSFSGLQYEPRTVGHYKIDSRFIREGYELQLVQVAHKKTEDRWMEREELVTEDLFIMFWRKLADKGNFMPTFHTTCYWTQHPLQRHKLIGEKHKGGINAYRSFYKTRKPIKIRLSKYKYIDENQIYGKIKSTHFSSGFALKILLVGELGYNPERICALEKQGCKLYGLWIKNPELPFANIGHFSFGNIEDIPYDDNWKQHVKDIRPDIIYALGNWDSIDLAYDVLCANLHIPFVWHFKESPLWAMSQNLWTKLFYLYQKADGAIFINEQVKEWYELFLNSLDSYLILDLDMPIKEYFSEKYSVRLSKQDGEIHTVVTGRLHGIGLNDIKELAAHHIHVHLYSENAHDLRSGEFLRYITAAPDYFHIHSHIPIHQ